MGLGTDGAAPSNADLFEEMKTLRYGSQAYWGLASFDPVVMRCKTLLQMAAQGGANALGWGEELGSVEVGKLADMVLLDRDIFTVDPMEIKDILPVMTIVGGKVVYKK